MINDNSILKQANRKTINFIIDCILILNGLMIIISGLTIQLRYHARRLDFSTSSFGLDYFQWLQIHKVLIVTSTIIIIIHIILHLKWYQTLIRKKLIQRNRLTITLNIVFLLTAITGFYAWSITLFTDNITAEHLIARKHFIEIHDKLGIILAILLLLHLKKHFRWLLEMGKKYVRQIFVFKPIIKNSLK